MCNICNNEIVPQSTNHQITQQQLVASYNYFKTAYEQTGDTAFQRHYLRAQELLKAGGIDV